MSNICCAEMVGRGTTSFVGLTYGDSTSFDLYLFISLDSIFFAAYLAMACVMVAGCFIDSPGIRWDVEE